ncbi:probable bifunctional dTTP/UTP pyrophosphatase/methyltransferase protein [Haliotis rubra]|uniref:probable bifunctional dTTP/UTP pyrophosphatase/methyltransferase protein n=1 Tax=Haliotis rubra TaxID=36100 RepID=UPI001EE5C4B7|nr:probable bifunctional dTTP/UTP pyrophosphatase/methyltransferase protein [Haliotis rubra]
MLQPIMHVLNVQRIILASGSPRRKQILQNIGLQFEAVPSTFEEDLDKSLFPHPSDYVKENARIKALDVANRLAGDKIVPDLVIGADTVVSMDNTIYEKPKSRDDAFKMITSLSGRPHTVYSGIALVSPSQSSVITSGELTKDGKFRLTLFHEGTDVMMTDMSEEVVRMYIETGEPMDKAGGYGIQAIGGTLVEGIRGDYFNVMGFPLHRFSRTLANLYQSQPSQT